MIRIISVTGDSLTPEFNQGDFVVVATNPLFLINIKRGDVLVFHNEHYGTMIKKFSHFEGNRDRLFVTDWQGHLA
jgi:phage repressor protein C with HTH and peptisase S24 domain